MHSTGFSYLVKNRLGIYYLQLRIPKHIRDNHPDLKPLVRKSLRTRNRREALRFARKLVVRMEDNDYQEDSLMEADIDRHEKLFDIGEPLFKEFLDIAESRNEIAMDNFWISLPPEENTALRFMIEENNEYLERFKKILSEGSAVARHDFMRRVPRVFKNNIQQALDRHLAGENDIQRRARVANPSSTPIQPASEEDPRLNVVFEKWKTAHNPPTMAKSSFEEYSRMIALFLRILKENNGNVMPRVSELSTKMIRQYRDTFEKIPRGARAANKSLTELTSMKGKEKSPTTIKGTYVNVGHFITWLDNQGYTLQDKVFKTLTYYGKINPKNKKKRVPLDDRDLKALFESNKYHLGQWTRASDFWVPLIALFSGMTRNEIVQLEVIDIYEKDSHYVIDINERGSKILKVSSKSNDVDEHSSGRPRIIPIHDKLMELGLIDFVKHQKDRDRTRLFPCEPRNTRGQFGAFGNRFSAYRKEVGVIPRDDKEYRDFHSFRHLMKTKLSEVEKNDGLLDDILGHSSSLRSETGRGYDHAKRIELKYDAISKVHYDCIDFSQIRGWRYHPFAKK